MITTRYALLRLAKMLCYLFFRLDAAHEKEGRVRGQRLEVG